MDDERKANGQFGAGNRANPNGRPRKGKSMYDEVKRELQAKVTITENGKRKRVSKLAANAKQIANQGASGEIRAAIARHPSHRRRMAVSTGEGRDSWTSYRVTERLLYSTLVEADLHTGRTHQIRVHLAARGHALIADAVYGGKPALGMTRQALHAARLAFAHPISGLALSFDSAPPADFAAAWCQVGYNASIP